MTGIPLNLGCQGKIMKTLRSVFGMLFIICSLTANAAKFGPKTEDEEKVKVAEVAAEVAKNKPKLIQYEYNAPKLVLAIPILDPGLPDGPADYKEEEVWPELRKAETVRVALKLQSTLEKTDLFSKVIVSPDTSVSADLFLLGVIHESNGEDFKMSVELYDTTGDRWLKKKTFKHRTNEKWFATSSTAESDPFESVYYDVARAVAKVVVKEGKRHAKVAAKNAKYIAKGKENKVRMSDIDKLVMIRQLLFARALAPDLYGETIEEKGGKWKLAYMPLTDDEEWGRVQAVKAADDKFLDHSTTNYELLTVEIDEPYSVWQRDAYPIARDARKARDTANAKMVLGVLGALAGAAAASSGGSSGTTQTAGLVAATAGVVAIASSFKSREESRNQAAMLDELGNSVQGVIAPKVIEMRDRQVELSGTATEQLAQWRSLLKEIYEDASVDPGAIDIVIIEEEDAEEPDEGGTSSEEESEAEEQVSVLM